MMDDMQEIKEEEENTSTNAFLRASCLTPPGRQALADSMMKSAVTASVSKLRRGATIYIVPQTIRQVNEVAYEPKIVSIGPYHNGKQRLQGVEEHKWMYLHSFLSRDPKHRLEDYLKAIEELEDEARSCYSEKVGPQVGNEFVKMMMLDGCFIVELFLRYFELKQKPEYNGPKQEVKDTIFNFNTTWMLPLIGYDMLLLENQIPFSILQCIFKMAHLMDSPHALAEMALHFFDQLMPTDNYIENKDPYHHLLHLFHSHLITTPTRNNDPNLSSNSTVESVQNKETTNLLCNPTIESVLNKLKNLYMFFPSSNKLQLPISNNPSPVSIKMIPCEAELEIPPSSIPEPREMIPCATDLQLEGVKFKKNEKSNTIKSILNMLKNLLITFLPCSNKEPSPSTKRRQMIPCATDLQLAGVKFKKNKKSNNILNVKFSHGVLEITPFEIDDHSDTLFRNLVAFEQCFPEKSNHFTTYIVFMDYLVNTSKDVMLLHQSGIIDNFLGSDDDVVNLFNRLCMGVFHTFEGSYLSDVKDSLQKRCEKKRYKWRASLKRDYFTNPWSVCSLIAAFILLALTITQTFFTVFPRF